MSGLPVWFRRYRMEFDLSRPVPAPEPVQPGFELVAWEEDLLEAHAWAKFQGFRDGADSAIFPSLGSEEGCLRLMRDISGRDNFLPTATWLAVHEDPDSARRIAVGTIQAMRSVPATGAIQNVAVIPEFRGFGLGSMLVRRSLAAMQQAGLEWGTLEVTARNVGALRLYLRLGFRVRQIVFKPGMLPARG